MYTTGIVGFCPVRSGLSLGYVARTTASRVADLVHELVVATDAAFRCESKHGPTELYGELMSIEVLNAFCTWHADDLAVRMPARF